jgi:hypothetical protein
MTDRDPLLESALDSLVPSFADAAPDWADAVRRGRRSRRQRLALAALAAAPIFIALLVGPAFGLNRGALPFFSAEKAPAQVRLDFARLQAGAPAGMDPRASTGETRKIMVSFFQGREHVLWVAPTARGGFCYEWTPAFGGCNADGHQALSAIGALAPVPGTTATPPPPSTTASVPTEYDSIPLWVAGYVKGDVESVVIHFEDGTEEKPQLTSVGAPIAASFFAYDVPPARETPTKRATSVEALAADGSVVQTQLLQ